MPRRGCDAHISMLWKCHRMWRVCVCVTRAINIILNRWIWKSRIVLFAFESQKWCAMHCIRLIVWVMNISAFLFHFSHGKKCVTFCLINEQSTGQENKRGTCEWLCIHTVFLGLLAKTPANCLVSINRAVLTTTSLKQPVDRFNWYSTYV